MTQPDPHAAHFRFGSQELHHESPCLIVAELSANHDHDFKRAADLIRAAQDAGADAVKLQTYSADTLTLQSNRSEFRIAEGTIWDGQQLYDLYKQAAMPWSWQPRLKELADDIGIPLFSSPFDATAVEFLEPLELPAYKIASFEIVDIPLLQTVARTGRSVILSTGMAGVDEIRLAIRTLQNHGSGDIALLKCCSAYPAPPDSMNLATISDLQTRFGVVCGLSDHTLSHEAAVASVCLGGKIIEKHLTLDREHPGPDSSFSLEPHEFAEMVRSVRTMESVLGTVHYGPNDSDRNNRKFRRSLFATADIQAGERFTPDNVRSIRPSNGLEPKHYDEVLEGTSATFIAKGTPLSWEHLAEQKLALH